MGAILTLTVTVTLTQTQTCSVNKALALRWASWLSWFDPASCSWNELAFYPWFLHSKIWLKKVLQDWGLISEFDNPGVVSICEFYIPLCQLRNVHFLFAEGEGAAGQPSICQNGGTYKTIQGTCECEPDYTGANCETGQLRPFFTSYNKVKFLHF